jgi:hypothetical protein
MPDHPNELLPLIQQTNARSPSFFSRIKNNSRQTIKSTALTAAGIFSGYMYWPSSFQAANFGGKPLQYTAAIGGSVTNAIFNIESFFNLFEIPNKITVNLTAFTIAVFCVLPNFLMNITDEEGNYTSDINIALQGFIAFLNVLVNTIGTVELIDSISDLCKTKTEQEKKELATKLDQAIKIFSRLKPEEQTELAFHNLINEQLKAPTHSNKIARYSIQSLVGVISIPQLLAYTLISYFDVKALAEKKWGLESTGSITLGALAAIGNTIPGAGFSIKGLNSICERLLSLEKPSLLACLFILPATFSGFTTHQAMQLSLKQLDYSGDFAKVLKWTANLGAALIYNLPQIILLADRITTKKNHDLPENIRPLIQTIKTNIKSQNTRPYQTCMTAPIETNHHNNKDYEETSLTYTSIQNR